MVMSERVAGVTLRGRDDAGWRRGSLPCRDNSRREDRRPLVDVGFLHWRGREAADWPTTQSDSQKQSQPAESQQRLNSGRDNRMGKCTVSAVIRYKGRQRILQRCAQKIGFVSKGARRLSAPTERQGKARIKPSVNRELAAFRRQNIGTERTIAPQFSP